MQNSDLQKNEENLYFVKNAQVSVVTLNCLLQKFYVIYYDCKILWNKNCNLCTISTKNIMNRG